MNRCNCPQCATDNCPAGIEIDELKRERDKYRRTADVNATCLAGTMLAVPDLIAERDEARKQVKWAEESELRFRNARDESAKEALYWKGVVRSARAELHQAGRITNEEYAALAQDTEARDNMATIDELREKLAAIGEYLWPNQTGLPNQHRDPLLAITTRERLAMEQITTLHAELEAARKELNALLGRGSQ